MLAKIYSNSARTLSQFKPFFSRFLSKDAPVSQRSPLFPLLFFPLKCSISASAVPQPYDESRTARGPRGLLQVFFPGDVVNPLRLDSIAHLSLTHCTVNTVEFSAKTKKHYFVHTVTPEKNVVFKECQNVTPLCVCFFPMHVSLRFNVKAQEGDSEFRGAAHTSGAFGANACCVSLLSTSLFTSVFFSDFLVILSAIYPNKEKKNKKKRIICCFFALWPMSKFFGRKNVLCVFSSFRAVKQKK